MVNYNKQNKVIHAFIKITCYFRGQPLNPASGFQGGEGKDLWDYYANRDPRLPINFEPPVQAKVTAVNNNPDNITTFKKWEFWKEGEDLNGKGNFTITAEYAEKFRRYIDYFGANTFCENLFCRKS